MMLKLVSTILMPVFLVCVLTTPAKAETSWDGLWFECEFGGRDAPPADDCAMLDDDGFLFRGTDITYVKVTDSPEQEDCKKQRAGQCIRADQPSITVTKNRSGTAELTPTTLGIRFLGCTQIYHTSQIGDFVEARPDDDRCYWAGEKYFYLRRYLGEIRFND